MKQSAFICQLISQIEPVSRQLTVCDLVQFMLSNKDVRWADWKKKLVLCAVQKMSSPRKIITGRCVAIFLFLLTQIDWTRCSQLTDTVIPLLDHNRASIGHVRYISDYEMQIKSSNRVGKHFVAYFIDEGDLSIKKHCKCQLMQRCKSNATVQLSKWVRWYI